MTSLNHGMSFLLNNFLLSNRYLITQTVDSQCFIAGIFYEIIPLTDMLSGLEVTKSTCMFIALTRSTSSTGICVARLKLTTLPRRTVNRL